MAAKKPKKVVPPARPVKKAVKAARTPVKAKGGYPMPKGKKRS